MSLTAHNRNWSSPEIDWSKTNFELSMQLECTPTRVQQKRHELGKAKSPKERPSWKEASHFRQFAKHKSA